MKGLILTKLDDKEAMLVKLSLASLGYEVRLLFPADFPTRQKHSIYVDQSESQWESQDKYDSFVGDAYDWIWWRIPRKWEPAADDAQNPLFFQEIEYQLAHTAPNAWWINDRSAVMRAKSLLSGLQTARDCGISIPATLCSNNPLDIRHFLLKHEAEGVTFQTLTLLRDSNTRATRLSFLDLPNNRYLQENPGIYQQAIKRKHEIKVLCFGHYILAMQMEAGHKDNEKKFSMDLHFLPKYLETGLKAFMDKAGLVFATFDLAINQEGQYLFERVNEQVAFLWIEESLPELRVLDIFIQFLLGKSKKFKWDPKQFRHKVCSYWEEMETLISRNRIRYDR